MKYIFLLFSVVVGQLCSTAYAQIKVDSIVIRLDSMLIYHSYFTSDNSGTTFTHDTIPNGKEQISFSTKSSDVSHDTLTLKGEAALVPNYAFPSSFESSVQLVFDTSQHLLKYLYFSALGGTAYQYNIYCETGNLVYSYVGNNIQNELSHLPRTQFSYHKASSNHQPGLNTSDVSDGIGVNRGEIILYISSVPDKVLGGSNSNEDFYITPNPASSFIRIVSLPQTLKYLAIFDILGKKIKDISWNSGITELQLDISSLPPGIYYLRAGNQLQKFVIQR